MSRRVQGEARKVKASKAIPSTVMDMCEQELKNAARKYVALKAEDFSTETENRIKTQRGVLRGLATAYCMWYGSTPGQPKKDMIRDVEMHHVKQARHAMQEHTD